MLLRIRHGLIVLVGAVWVALTVFALPWDLSRFEQFTWFAAMFLAMFLVDRLYVAIVRRLRGIDARTLHWSQRRTRDGRFFCPACHGAFLLPPEDLADEDLVTCGDCGHAIAPYGEMKPLANELGRAQVRQMAARLLRRWL